MHNFFGLVSFMAALLLQTTMDYGSPIAAGIALIGVGLTIWGQFKQKRLERELKQQQEFSQTKLAMMDRVLAAHENLSKERSAELADMRSRLSKSERHTRICERGQMKLVLQLVKNGIDIDVDAVMDGLSIAEQEEMAHHVTQEPNSKP